MGITRRTFCSISKHQSNSGADVVACFTAADRSGSKADRTSVGSSIGLPNLTFRPPMSLGHTRTIYVFVISTLFSSMLYHTNCKHNSKATPTRDPERSPMRNPKQKPSLVGTLIGTLRPKWNPKWSCVRSLVTAQINNLLFVPLITNVARKPCRPSHPHLP